MQKIDWKLNRNVNDNTNIIIKTGRNDQQIEDEK